MDRILITGAAGHIGGVLRKGLAGRYGTVRLFDKAAVETAREGEEAVTGDLADFETVRAAMEGIDAVVHLGAVSGEGPWPEILRSNIEGTWNVFEAARQAGTERVILASSNHAIGFYPRDQRIDHAVPKRPDTRYGVSKAFGEDLARMYVDKHGLKAFCMRIGSFQPEPKDARMLATWLSYPDMVRLVSVGLDSADYDYAVVYGISGNARAWWDNHLAYSLGYRPQDDAEAWAAELLAQNPPEKGGRLARALQGGAFVELD